MATMKRAALVTKLAEVRGISKTEATSIVDDVSQIASDCLATEGDVLKLPPLGTFKVEHKPARKCRNPRTGESIMTQPKDVVKYKQ